MSLYPYDSKVLSESSSLTLLSGTQFVHTVIIIVKLYSFLIEICDENYGIMLLD